MELDDIVGKTIASAKIMKLPEYDDECRLLLEFTDGTKALIVGGYSGWDDSRSTEREYEAWLSMTDEIDPELVPVE